VSLRPPEADPPLAESNLVFEIAVSLLLSCESKKQVLAMTKFFQMFFIEKDR